MDAEYIFEGIEKRDVYWFIKVRVYQPSGRDEVGDLNIVLTLPIEASADAVPTLVEAALALARKIVPPASARLGLPLAGSLP